jgi:hypothetical protein
LFHYPSGAKLPLDALLIFLLRGKVTVSNFSIENIGAFELNNALHVSSDAALEGVMPLIASPTSSQYLCSTTQKMGTAGCVSHDDAALEASAGRIYVGSTQGQYGAPCTVLQPCISQNDQH